MKKKPFFVLCLFLISILCVSSPVYAAENNTQKDDIDYIDIQSKIISDIEDISESESEYEDEITKNSTLIHEKNEVLTDLRNDLGAIRSSFSEPITIYEEVITDSYDVGIESVYYETQKIISYRTYNGITTKVESVIGYYIMENVKVGGVNCDAFRMTSSNISFSASGDAHVSRIYAKHHQRGPDLNNIFRVVFDGNVNSSDRTDKTFSISSSNGSANWSKSNSTYSALVSPTYYGGYVGTFYTVYFTWPDGGAGYKHDTLERTNGFGQIPA